MRVVGSFNLNSQCELQRLTGVIQIIPMMALGPEDAAEFVRLLDRQMHIIEVSNRAHWRTSVNRLKAARDEFAAKNAAVQNGSMPPVSPNGAGKHPDAWAGTWP